MQLWWEDGGTQQGGVWEVCVTTSLRAAFWGQQRVGAVSAQPQKAEGRLFI